jgi:hypothetical protein
MPDQVALQLATRDDLPLIQAVFRDVLPLYRELMPGAFEGNIETIDILIETAEADFSATGLRAELILIDGQAQGILAWAALLKGPAYLAAMHFFSAVRRKGFGGKALALLEQTLIQAGFDTLFLLAHQEAPWAINFYLKQGYQILATEPAAILAQTGEQMAHLLMPGLVLIGKTWAQT